MAGVFVVLSRQCRIFAYRIMTSYSAVSGEALGALVQEQGNLPPLSVAQRTNAVAQCQGSL
jgi:hypothetical protein